MTVDRTPFQGPAGALEARRHGPEDGRPVMLLHPHPEGGGTMGSRLVYDLAKGLAEEGFRTARFNYRGVRQSEGEHSGGPGEVEDAKAVYDALVEDHGTAPVVIGHSFGGRIAVHLATEREVPLLILIGTPPQVAGSDFVPRSVAEKVNAPVYSIVGDQDEFVTPEEAKEMARAFPDDRGVVVLKGAGHFLSPEDNPRVLTTVEKILESA